MCFKEMKESKLFFQTTPFGVLRYSLINSELFSINALDGRISLAQNLPSTANTDGLLVCE